MALGFCELCGQLVKIIPGEMRNDKQRRWYPLPHDGCGGDEREVADHPEKLTGFGTIAPGGASRRS